MADASAGTLLAGGGVKMGRPIRKCDICGNEGRLASDICRKCFLSKDLVGEIRGDFKLINRLNDKNGKNSKYEGVCLTCSYLRIQSSDNWLRLNRCMICNPTPSIFDKLYGTFKVIKADDKRVLLQCSLCKHKKNMHRSNINRPDYQACVKCKKINSRAEKRAARYVDNLEYSNET